MTATKQPNLVLAPHSQEAEEALIGSVVVNPDAYYSAEHLTAEHFYLVRNGYVWEAICRIMARRDALDFVSLQNELGAMNRLNDVGGPGYLIHLVNATPTSVNVATYAALVERAATRRLLMVAADEIKALAMDEQNPIEQVTGAAEARVLRAIGGGAGNPLQRIGEIAETVWDASEAIRQDGKPRPIPTPWTQLNSFDLLIPGRYGIVAGRPGMGKSWILLLLALHLARLGYPVFFFSLEMTQADLTERALSAVSGVQSQKLNNGTINETEWERFTDASMSLRQLPLFIDTPPSGTPMTPALLRARVRRGLHQFGYDKPAFVMLDYIQHERMSGGERFEKQTNRHRELSYVSAALASLAIDTNSMVITAAQLGREVAERANKRPVKEDLKESGSLEQDAWWVLLLHSDDYYTRPQAQIIQLDMIIDKNRGGALGTAQFQFDRSIGRVW